MQHTNNLGTAHGGILCSLLVIAMGAAAWLRAERSVPTLDMQTCFLNPGHGVLLAEGVVVRAGRSVLFREATVMTEADGDLVVTATGLLTPVSRA